MSAEIHPDRAPSPAIGFREFVALVATMMATNALAIDIMLPALPDIGNAVGIPTENERQWIITAYMLGFGTSQLFYGPLADRFGRRPVLLFGLTVYSLFSLLGAFASSFEGLMIARALQGLGSGAARVLAVTIVRDRFAGRQMARVMSLSFVVFLAAPIIAPSIGQVIVLVAPWRYIFGFLAVFGAALTVWAGTRLPETLHPEDVRPISPRAIWSAFKLTVTTRMAVGYMLGMTAMFGGLIGFINSSQQVFVDVFEAPRLFTTIFALTAVALAIASLLNARIVGKFGMRVVSHAALLGYLFFACVHAMVAWLGYETLLTFALLQSAMMFCFGLVGPNFGTLALEPLGHIAGTASSVQGLITTVGGALIGFGIGQSFDNSTVPLTIGYVMAGLAALTAVLFTERGRLMRPTPQPPQ